MKNLQQLKVAIIYDRANTSYGGAEQVLLAIQEIYPQAELLTSIYNSKKALWANRFKNVKTTFLNKIKFLRNQHQWLAFSMPLAFELLNLSKYDLIISVTSAEAKGVITTPNQLHICYLLSPPRYLYKFKNEYLNSRRLFKVTLIKQISLLFLKYLQWWDQVAIRRPDVIIPLSQEVAKRVYDSYNITVNPPVYPPVDMINLGVDESCLNELSLPTNFNLVVSRLVFYKKVDLAIKACAKLEQNLIVVGEGEERRKLQELAKKVSRSSSFKIIFLPSQSQKVVNALMKKADLFLSVGIDDFGLAPLQANLFGTPAIINSQSGVAEIYSKIDLGGIVNSSNITELVNKITQTSSKKIKSANIESVKKICGKNQFQQSLLSIISSNLKTQ